MGGPITGDDGGSIRIRLGDGGKTNLMDSLFNIEKGPTKLNRRVPKKRKWSQHDIIAPRQDPYKEGLIHWLDGKGQYHHRTIPRTFKKVRIYSEFGQNVAMEKVDRGSKLRLTIYCDATEPIIESKKYKKFQCYVVANSGSIRKIRFDNKVENIPKSALYACVVVY
jgi:hypothetical protein